MVDLQKLIRTGINDVYIEVSSQENVKLLLEKLIKIKFFTNTHGWISRNTYKMGRGEMKYLILNLKTREVAFNRDSPSDELLKIKLFINEDEDFVNAGPRKKLAF